MTEIEHALLVYLAVAVTLVVLLLVYQNWFMSKDNKTIFGLHERDYEQMLQTKEFSANASRNTQRTGAAVAAVQRDVTAAAGVASKAAETTVRVAADVQATAVQVAAALEAKHVAATDAAPVATIVPLPDGREGPQEIVVRRVPNGDH